MSPPPRRPTRRQLLRAGGATLATSIAGCLDTGDTNASGATNTRTSPVQSTRTPKPGSPLVWRRTLGSAVQPAPTVSDRTVYVGTKAGSLAALSTSDGQKRWSVDLGEPIQSTPLAVDGMIVVLFGTHSLNANHRVRAFDAATGKERWTFEPDSWWAELLGTRDGTLYVGTADDMLSDTGQTLYAVSLADGSEQWSAEIGDPRAGLVTEDAVYVPAYGRLYAYNARDGTRRWTKPLSDYRYGTVAATSETVFYVDESEDSRGRLFAVDAASGDEKWRFDEWSVTSTARQQGTLFVGGDHVAAFDATGGATPHWQAPQSGFVTDASPRGDRLFAGGDAVRAYAGSDGTLQWDWQSDAQVLLPAGVDDGVLYLDAVSEQEPNNRYKFALDADGTPRWQFERQTELTDLAVGDGRAFTGGQNGIVYAIGE